MSADVVHFGEAAAERGILTSGPARRSRKGGAGNSTERHAGRVAAFSISGRDSETPLGGSEVSVRPSASLCGSYHSRRQGGLVTPLVADIDANTEGFAMSDVNSDLSRCLLSAYRSWLQKSLANYQAGDAASDEDDDRELVALVAFATADAGSISDVMLKLKVALTFDPAIVAEALSSKFVAQKLIVAAYLDLTRLALNERLGVKRDEAA